MKICFHPYLRLGTEAKIDELQVRIFIDEDVFWLEVPMCITYGKIFTSQTNYQVKNGTGTYLSNFKVT
jgi:hypothetical protein